MIEVAVLIVAVVLVWLFLNYEADPVDQIPGPPTYPIIGNVLELSKMSTDGFINVVSVYSKQYGERYKFQSLNKRIVNITGPQDAEIVLKQSKDIEKSMPYRFLTDWLGAGLLLSAGTHWHNRRKILTPTFHFNILKNFAPIIEEKVERFVDMLKEKDGEEVDLLPKVSSMTLAAICETAMGTKLDKDKSSATLEYKEAVFHLSDAMLKRLSNIWLHSDFIYKLSSQGKKFYKDLAIAQNFADKVIMDRKAKRAHAKSELEAADDTVGTKKRMAMLDLLLEAEEKGEIDMAGIREEVNTFMFAGHDTTALALTYAMMLLADYPEVQELLYEECLSIFGDSDRPAEISDLADMKYLDAVIKETLRLYPSAPSIGREVVDEFKLGDILIKKGTTVVVHMYHIHHREDLFPEAEKFKPERFLTNEHRHPYAYIPFSAGPRNCIGQKFAMQEMKCTLSEVIRNFKLVPKVPGFRPQLNASIVLRPIEPVYIKFIRREQKKN